MIELLFASTSNAQATHKQAKGVCCFDRETLFCICHVPHVRKNVGRSGNLSIIYVIIS